MNAVILDLWITKLCQRLRFYHKLHLRLAMPHRLLILPLVALILAGCSQTRIISNAEGGIRPSEFNKAVAGKRAEIVLKNGQKIHGKGILVASDSTSYYSAKEDAFKTISTADIQEINLLRTGRGALAGLGIGVASGAAFGFVRGMIEGDDPPAPVYLTREEKMVLFPIAHAVYASLFSTPLGAIIGTSDTYRLESLTPGSASTASASVFRVQESGR